MNPSSPSVAFIAAGTNIGNREGFICKALDLISENEKISLQNISSLYESAPLGEASQNQYLNFVFSCSTTLPLDDLFVFLKETELKAGRQTRKKWSEREIDLDILLYDRLTQTNEKLTVPHKEMKNRDFVLVPLLEIAPQITEPGTEIPYRNFLNRLESTFILHKLQMKLYQLENKFFFKNE